MIPVRALATGLLGFLLWGLASPGAGAGVRDCRRRLCDDLADQETGYTRADVQVEIRVGREVAARILGRFPLHEDEGLTRYVNLVGAVLARNASRPELTYRFAVLDTGAVNAFAAPGGYVFITRGAVRAMNSEAELAAVLAHEIAHVDRRHIVRDLGLRAPEGGLQTGLVQILGAGGGSMRVAFQQAVEGAMKILLERGYRVEQEAEADQTAVELLAVAGYRPQALAAYLERIRDPARERAGRFTRTHPVTDRRLRSLWSLFPREQPLGVVLEGRFRRHVPAL